MIHIKIVLDTAGTFQDVQIVQKPEHIDLKIEEVIKEDDNWFEE